MTEKEIKVKIIDKIEEVSKSISKGKDIEITKTASGIAIKEVSKKKIT